MEEEPVHIVENINSDPFFKELKLGVAILDEEYEERWGRGGTRIPSYGRNGIQNVLYPLDTVEIYNFIKLYKTLININTSWPQKWSGLLSVKPCYS